MPVTADQYGLTSYLPTQPPEEVREWAEKKGAGNANAIIYRSGWREDPFSRKKEKCAECTCSACGTTFQTEKSAETKTCAWGCGSGVEFGIKIGTEYLFSNSHTLCPICGAEVEIYKSTAISSEGREINRQVYVMFLVLPGGTPAAVSWIWRRKVFKEGNARTLINPLEAYAFCGKKAYRYAGWWRYQYRICYGDRFYECARCSDELGEIMPEQIYPFRKNVFDGTVLENAKIDVYVKDCKDRCYPITYIRTYQQHNQVENLVMQNCSRILNDLIYANSYSCYGYSTAKIPRQGIFWRTKRPAEMLSLSTEQFRACRKERWTLDEVELVRSANAFGLSFDILRYRKSKISHSDAKRIIFFGQDPFRAMEYIARQNKKGGAHKEMNIYWLIDYWDTCRKLQIDLTPRIAYPQNLCREHDRVVALYNEKEINIKAKKYINKNGRFEELAAQYSDFAWESEGLCIRIAAAPRELLEEGTVLGHCVGTYIDTHAKGNHCIFFVRRIDAPADPFFTLELDMQSLHVIQNRGKKNCARTPEVVAFEAAWLQHIAAVAAVKTMRKGA